MRLSSVLAPRDREFFDLFEEAGGNIVRAADLLDRMLRAFPDKGDDLARDILICEQDGDRITHDIIRRLNETFVTPIDREDIHLLASALDEVIDLIDGTARRAQMFRITEAREPAHRMTAIIIQAAAAIQVGVKGVKSSKDVATQARQIKVLEEEGDAVYHEAVGPLFDGTPDPLEVIKWKELYDKLEDTLDQCEDVGNVLESISIKNS